MRIRDLMKRAPYVYVHPPRDRWYVYATKTNPEPTPLPPECSIHPSVAPLRALAALTTIPLPVYNQEGNRYYRSDRYALHVSDGRVLAIAVTGIGSANGVRRAEDTRGLAYDALILDVTRQSVHQDGAGNLEWDSLPPTARLHYKDLGPRSCVESYLQTLTTARVPAALHHPTDGWTTGRKWDHTVSPEELDRLVLLAASAEKSLRSTMKGIVE